MKKYYLFGLILCCYQFTLFAQKNKVDSLENILKNAKNDTTRLSLYIALSDACDINDNLKYAEPAVKLTEKLLSQAVNVKEREKIMKQKAVAFIYFIAYFDNKNDTAKRMEYVNKQLSIYQDIQDTLSYSFAMMDLSVYYRRQGNFPQAIACCQKLMSESEKLHFQRGIAIALLEMGGMYADQGDTALALENYKKVLTIAQQYDKNDLAHAYKFMGDIYSQIHNVSKALECYQNTISLYEGLKDERRLCKTYGDIGAMYKENKDYTIALLNYQKSLSMAEDLNMPELVKEYLDCIGMIYRRQGDAEKALEYHLKALKMAENLHSESGVVWSYLRLARVYQYQKNFMLAKEYIDRVLALKNGFELSMICDAEEAAYQIDSALGNGNGAFDHYKQYIILRDKLKSEEVLKAASKEKFQNEYDRQKAVAKLEQDKKDAVTKMIIWSVVGGLFIVIVFAGFIFRSLRVTRKQKGIIEEQKHRVDEANEELNQQNEEIAAQRDDISQQKSIVERQKKDITDSIVYASWIQTSLLPPQEILTNSFPEHFILYKPKDIVSGDFYWLKQINNYIYIVAADCTGHGVPGAFMSMLGISLLNDLVGKRDINPPSEILNELRKRIKKTLHQTAPDSSSKDGMDIAMCMYDFETKALQYSGAFNSLIIVKSNNELIEIKADRMPVGSHPNDNMSFTNHQIELEEGDTIYIYSDGYISQFGGDKNEKYKMSWFKELLIKVNDKHLEEQKSVLDQTLIEWQGAQEQVDDVLVIGIKV